MNSVISVKFNIEKYNINAEIITYIFFGDLDIANCLVFGAITNHANKVTMAIVVKKGLSMFGIDKEFSPNPNIERSIFKAV